MEAYLPPPQERASLPQGRAVFRRLLLPSDEEAAEAASLAKAFAVAREHAGPDAVPRPRISFPESGEEVPVPAILSRLLAAVAELMASFKGVVIVPLDRDLTTQQAAELLGVSRPFLVRLIEDGEVEHYRVGTHRRVPLSSLLQYMDRRAGERRRILDELARRSQEDGLLS